ncbi:MAG: hypothetical protein WDO16_21200 [Bacteroidota bacterium]
MTKAIAEGPYKKQALVPASPWLDNKPPAVPAVTVSSTENEVTLNWQHPDEKDVFHWVVYQHYGNAWSFTILNNKDRSINLKKIIGENASKASLNKISVTAVDRTGNESLVKEIAVQ